MCFFYAAVERLACKNVEKVLHLTLVLTLLISPIWTHSSSPVLSSRCEQLCLFFSSCLISSSVTTTRSAWITFSRDLSFDHLVRCQANISIDLGLFCRELVHLANRTQWHLHREPLWGLGNRQESKVKRRNSEKGTLPKLQQLYKATGFFW